MTLSHYYFFPARFNVTSQKYDAVVIGAGHNGLTAAAYLGAAGLTTLVLERREIVGGCCVTEEITPGCRASTTSYIASMLLPRVVRDLDLGAHGLRMVPCNPAVQVPFNDQIIGWWAAAEKTAQQIRKFSAPDAAAFIRVQEKLKKLARYLQPFFLEPPPRVGSPGLEGLKELLRVAKRFWSITDREIADLVAFLTGSIGDFLDRNFERAETKTLILANNVYGKHGGPYQMGTALGLLFHLLSGGERDAQGFSGHVIGGMGSITRALAEAGRKRGVEVRTSAAVVQIVVRQGRATGVVLEDGTEISARVVLSNADPKRTFLGLLKEEDLPEEFRQHIRGIKMDGPSAKINLVLDQEPRITGIPPSASPGERAVFTCLSSLESAERCYDAAKYGELAEDLWVDCVVPTSVDNTLAPPNRHILLCFVQFVPYHLRHGTWDEKRELLFKRVIETVARYAHNVPNAIVAQQVLTPLDLERIYGLTEGNIFHGDLTLENLFFMRPIPGWAQYRSPITGLYLCGAGAHPGGGVTGGPGHNSSHQVLRDLRKRGVV